MLKFMSNDNDFNASLKSLMLDSNDRSVGNRRVVLKHGNVKEMVILPG